VKIFITGKTGASKDEIKRIDDLHYQVSVKEQPIKGKANKAIEEALADYFDLPKSNVRIVSGYTSRHKIVELIY
jgi:hypothetical protein